MRGQLGEPRLARTGIVVLAAGLAVTGLARNWPVLVIGLTLMPLGTAYINEYLPGPSRFRLASLAAAGFSLGAVGASVIGILFSQRYGWQVLFYVGTIAAILVATQIVKARHQRRRAYPRTSTARLHGAD